MITVNQQKLDEILAKKESEIKIQKNLSRIAFGSRLKAELASANQDAVQGGVLTVQQLIEVEASLATIQRLIDNCSLELAIAALQQTTVPHLPQATKDAFIAKMQAYLAAE